MRNMRVYIYVYTVGEILGSHLKNIKCSRSMSVIQFTCQACANQVIDTSLYLCRVENGQRKRAGAVILTTSERMALAWTRTLPGVQRRKAKVTQEELTEFRVD